MSLSALAQDKYFHELKGFEDSTGTTHLFYRIYENTTFQCGEGNDFYVAKGELNNIYHLDTSNDSDSLKFYSGWGEWCIPGVYDGSRIISDYNFINNDPSIWLTTGGFECGHGLEHADGNSFSFMVPCVIKTIPKSYPNFQDQSQIFLSPSETTIYVFDYLFKKFIPLSTDSKKWPDFISEFEDYDGYELFIDSVGISYQITALHPETDSLIYAVLDEESYLSDDSGTTFTKIDSSNFFKNLRFDGASNNVYCFNTSSLYKSDNFGKPGSWQLVNLPVGIGNILYLSADANIPGHFYVADEETIYESLDYGATFSGRYTPEFPIQGIYAAPENSLYVLTTEELLKIGNNRVTLVKALPVANEIDTEIPSQVELYQNYPNPFNPSTNISFTLPKTSKIRLAIYDLLGREIQVLVNDEILEPGSYTKAFIGNDISSGIYVFHLIAYEAGESISKKMTLIK